MSTLQYQFYYQKEFFGGVGLSNFRGTTPLVRVEVNSLKIIIYFSWTYKKLHCKGEPNWYSGKEDPFLHTGHNPATFIQE